MAQIVRGSDANTSRVQRLIKRKRIRIPFESQKEQTLTDCASKRNLISREPCSERGFKSTFFLALSFNLSPSPVGTVQGENSSSFSSATALSGESKRWSSQHPFGVSSVPSRSSLLAKRVPMITARFAGSCWGGLGDFTKSVISL